MTPSLKLQEIDRLWNEINDLKFETEDLIEMFYRDFYKISDDENLVADEFNITLEDDNKYSKLYETVAFFDTILSTLDEIEDYYKKL